VKEFSTMVVPTSTWRPTRRRLLSTAALVGVGSLVTGCSSASEDAAQAGPAAKAEDVQLVESVRSLSNSYHANWVAGGKLFGQSVGKEVTVVTDEADSQKQLSQIKSLGGSGKVFALNVDPNTSADAEAIVRAVSESGGYVVTQWNKPDDLNPWDVSDHWVAHISFDGRVSGKEVSAALFDAMGGSGGIIAIQGILDNTSAKQRFAGLEAALGEASGIDLLDQQTANWSRSEALSVTQTLLAKHRGKVKGLWAANDEMALGALEALKAAGLAGKVPIVGFDAVPQALDEVQSGKNSFVATVSTDAYWQGGAALSLAFQAATGKVDVAGLSQEQRAFFGRQSVVTKDNAAEFTATPTLEKLQADFDDPWARSLSSVGLVVNSAALSAVTTVCWPKKARFSCGSPATSTLPVAAWKASDSAAPPCQ
jgi:ribose transport system substrate-binding protein